MPRSSKMKANSSCGRFGPPVFSRREMLRRGGLGLGSLALAAMLGEEGRLFAADGNPALPLPARGPAKSVILLHMGGGVSQVDSFDPKPALARYAGQDVPESIAKLVPMGSMRLRLKNLYACPFEFR